MIINKVIVPETIGDGAGQLIYKDGKLVSYEHGSVVNVYLFHEQDGDDVRALELTMSMPMTYDKCLNAAEMAVYGLQNAMDVAAFNASLARKQRNGEDAAEVAEHDLFMNDVKDELASLGIGSETVSELEKVRRAKIRALDEYDNSSAVNSFSYGGVEMWLDDATRTKLSKRFDTDEVDGKEVTKLIYDDIPYELPIATARTLLHAIESYARDCFDRTNEHRAAIRSLQTLQAIEDYDFTVGYPQKLVF